MRPDPPSAVDRRHHRCWLPTVALIGCATGLLSVCGCASSDRSTEAPRGRQVTSASPSRPAVDERAEAADQLAALIGHSGAVTGVRYSARDTLGHPLDTLKVIAGTHGDYLGIYHYQDEGGVFTTAIATSRDLIRWTMQTVVATHASQPTFAGLSDGAYVVVAEADDQDRAVPSSRWLRFWHYPSLQALLHAQADRTFDAPRTLGKPRGGAEGTPNLYASTPSELRVGFHYLAAGGVDREAVGELRDFSQWTSRPDSELDAALSDAGADGKHGDRDCLTFAGRQLVLVEAQQDLGSDWEVYIYDRVTHVARYLPITTPQSSSAFANPSITALKGPRGRALVVTLFLPSSGAAATEAGERVQISDLAPGTSVMAQCA